MGDAKDQKHKVICTFCNTEHLNKPVFKDQGNNIGNSQNLSRELMANFYGNQPQRSHPLSMPKGKGSCAQAHHLICCQSMEDDNWGLICSNFGYNIDSKENGVLLPGDMRIACQLRIPLHRGNHSATENGKEKIQYVEGVINKIEPIKKAAIKDKEYCKEGNDIIEELNKESRSIWNKIIKFKWILTYDGLDYETGPRGCLGETGLSKKREIDTPDAICTKGRNHNITTLIKHTFEEQK